MGNNTNDNYPAAAVRHFKDGKILHQYDRPDNAMCHYAFSAECGIKTLYEQLYSKSGFVLKHGVAKTWSEMLQYYDILRIMDARAGAFLGNRTIPARLFENHPARRYWDNITYTEDDLDQACAFSEQLTRQIISEILDGKIMI